MNRGHFDILLLDISKFRVDKVNLPLPRHSHPLHPFLVGQVLLFEPTEMCLGPAARFRDSPPSFVSDWTEEVA